MRTQDPPDTTTGGWVRARGATTCGALLPELNGWGAPAAAVGASAVGGALDAAAVLGTASATAPMAAAAAEPDMTATVMRRTRTRASSRCPTASYWTCRWCAELRLGAFRVAGLVVM